MQIKNNFFPKYICIPTFCGVYLGMENTDRHTRGVHIDVNLAEKVELALRHNPSLPSLTRKVVYILWKWLEMQQNEQKK